METINNIFSLISAISTAFAAVFAAVQLHRTRKSQEKTEDNAKKIASIEAYNKLQEQVLDKFVSYPKSEIWNLVRNLDEPEVKSAYDDCRAMIAKIEHFSVGVNNDIYDVDIVDSLGGVHLIYLYDKVEPVINQTRKNQKDERNPYYSEFEKLKNTLKEKHSELE